jgi:hypothetical protein
MSNQQILIGRYIRYDAVTCGFGSGAFMLTLCKVRA